MEIALCDMTALVSAYTVAVTVISCFLTEYSQG